MQPGFSGWNSHNKIPLNRGIFPSKIMSTIIQPVSYKPEQSQDLQEKLSAYMGIHILTLSLSNGNEVEGIISEIGQDFITIIYPESENITLVPIRHIVSINCPQ